MVLVHSTIQEQIRHFLEGRDVRHSVDIARDDGHDEEYCNKLFLSRGSNIGLITCFQQLFCIPMNIR